MPISNFFIPRILNWFQQGTDYSDDDIDDMRYVLRAFLWELEKTLYFTIIFLLLGLGWHIAVAMFAVLTIRPLSGGFHSDSPWRCFWWTLLGFVLAIIVFPIIPMSILVFTLVAIFSIVIIFIGSPIHIEELESFVDKSKNQSKKIKATLITIIWFLILFFKLNHVLAPAVMWIIFLQAFQLGFEYLRRKFKANKKKQLEHYSN